MFKMWKEIRRRNLPPKGLNRIKNKKYHEYIQMFPLWRENKIRRFRQEIRMHKMWRENFLQTEN